MNQRNSLPLKWSFAKGSGNTLWVVTAVWFLMLVVWYTYRGGLTATLAFLATAVWLMILYFFRDPDRNITSGDHLVISPGDGRIMAIVTESEAQYLSGAMMQRISIFLSLTNVHVQRSPVTGRVMRIVHKPGKFLKAYMPEASIENEHIAMVLETMYGTILLKQITGLVARRCVNYAQPEDTLTLGERFGMMKFGSRVDLYLPLDAKILVKIDDMVYGGVTPIAQFPNGGSTKITHEQ